FDPISIPGGGPGGDPSGGVVVVPSGDPGAGTTGNPGTGGVVVPGGGTSGGGSSGGVLPGTGADPSAQIAKEGDITRLYYDLLHRSPSAAEMAGWQSALDPRVSLEQIAMTFTSSAEYQGNLVRGLYRAYLGREAEAGAIESWLRQRGAGATQEQVAA